jgi:hypothetical protein
VRAQADSTKCTSNLRQIGSAINLYCNDNDSRLPGPLSHLQYPRNDSAGTPREGSLARLLEKYLDLEDKRGGGSTEHKNTVFLCPSWQKAMKNADAPSYTMNFRDQIKAGDETGTASGDQPPWGDVSQGSEPVKKAMLSTWPITENAKKPGEDREYMNLAETWALKDTDQKDFDNETPVPGERGQLALDPVHETHRNALFYDFHVGKLDLDDTVKR